MGKLFLWPLAYKGVGGFYKNMNSYEQQLFKEEDLENRPIKIRPKVFEPKSRYDYVKVVASIVKRPIPQMLSLTKHFKDSWFWDIASECKQLKTEEAKAKFIWWFIRESRLK